jgi:SAM-dependent methyltransferase
LVHPDIELPPLPAASKLCKLLQTRAQVDACTLYLKQSGYVPHSLSCKNWDLAHIIPAVVDGNFLDMGSSDSYILKNLALKRIRGELYGIDLRAPDVPISAVKYLVGDLMHTPLPDGHFSNITCLSVLEHEVDYDKFAAEAARLLAPGGRVFVTFDYWQPKVVPPLKLYGLDWVPLDAAMVRRFIASCARHGLAIDGEFDFTAGDPVIHWGYYSPHPDVSYTFGMAVFRKQ